MNHRHSFSVCVSLFGKRIESAELFLDTSGGEPRLITVWERLL